MDIRHHNLGFAARLQFASEPGDGLHMIRAAGRGIQVDLPPGWISIWMPLSGVLEFEAPEDNWTLAAGRLMLARERRLRGCSRSGGWWLALCGPAAAWSQHLTRTSDARNAELFPCEIPCSREMRRLLVRLARQPGDPEQGNAEIRVLADTLCATMVESQSDLQQRLHRCSGRTSQRRKQTMMRLLRVKMAIEHREDGKLDLPQLAHIAGYSRHHLIRIFRDVFDETPFEYASRLRFERAWKMVHDTGMPVCEITEALGFESQSAFCRAFKNSFGMTTTELRRIAMQPVGREVAAAA